MANSFNVGDLVQIIDGRDHRNKMPIEEVNEFYTRNLYKFFIIKLYIPGEDVFKVEYNTHGVNAVYPWRLKLIAKSNNKLLKVIKI